MWRKRSAAVAVLAALMAIVMATPAVAEGDFIPSEKTLGSGGADYKYSYNYASREYTGGTQWSYNSQPVKGAVHPAQTAYERKVAARNAAAAEKPLAGKIIEPGKTVVRAPSTYGPVAKFATGLGAVGGQLGWTRLLGGIGIGIGGTSLAPANRAEIAEAQGISGGCVVNAACTADERQKLFRIDSCGQLAGASSCDAIGAKGVTGETDMQKWFSDEALPFLEDLWAQITGQKESDQQSDTHVDLVNVLGCYRDVSFEYLGNNTGKAHYGGQIVAPKPASGSAANAWQSGCGDLTKRSGSQHTVTTECMSPTTGLFRDPVNNVTYGRQLSIASMFNNETTNLNTTQMCSNGLNGNVPANVVLVEVRFWNSTTQAAFDATIPTGRYTAPRYSDWINPDPEIDRQEDTKITTNWQCQTNDGSYTHSFSKSVAKTAAVIAPDCPAGSRLLNHQITATDASGGNPITVDAGQETPGAAAQYPACLGSGSTGCTMDVHIDGQVCTAAKAECRNWPAIAAQTPSRVQCKWGEYTLTTANCNAISNGYQSESGVVFDPRADTWVAIDAFGNPIAPNPQPWSPTNPAPAVGQTPGTGTTPGPGTGTSPIPGAGVSPGTSNNCTAPSWSWNPVEWVYSPVVCALADAFVPKTDVSARVAELQTLTLDRPPLNWINPVVAGPGGGGCPNWNIVLPGVSQNVVCESSFTAAVVGARGALFGLVATAMVWPLMRSIWYAAIPILRVTPGSSK